MDVGSANMSEDSDSSYEDTLNRKVLFEKYYASNISDPNSIFTLPGMNFRQFSCSRITFRFWPCKLVDYVLPKVSFICVLAFDGKHWRLKRDTFPVNYKWPIYKLFWDRLFLRISDDNLLDVIIGIYNKLYEWSRFHNIWRKDKYKRYQEGDSDVTLDSDDEQLFLNEEERIERARRKKAILQRMLPPEKKQRRRRMRISSSEDDSN